MTDDSTLPQNGPCFSLAFSADGEWLITRDGVHRYMTENEKSLVFEMARELYDRFVMGGWEPKDAYGQIAELITRYGEIINTNAPLPPPQARRPDSPTKILIALIQHGYCPNCGCDQWNTAGCPICPLMRQSYDFLVTAGIKEPRNYAEYMAADPINQRNMAESAPQEAGALTVKQAHTICEQLCFHVAMRGGEGNPFKGMKWDWFADLAAPHLIELLRAASGRGVPLEEK